MSDPTFYVTYNDATHRAEVRLPNGTVIPLKNDVQIKDRGGDVADQAVLTFNDGTRMTFSVSNAVRTNTAGGHTTALLPGNEIDTITKPGVLLDLQTSDIGIRGTFVERGSNGQPISRNFSAGNGEVYVQGRGYLMDSVNADRRVIMDVSREYIMENITPNSDAGRFLRNSGMYVMAMDDAPIPRDPNAKYRKDPQPARPEHPTHAVTYDELMSLPAPRFEMGTANNQDGIVVDRGPKR